MTDLTDKQEEEEKKADESLFEPLIGEKRKQFLKFFCESVKEKKDYRQVISLNAPWGAGKTLFLNHLKETLEKENHSVILYDAWKNDYHKNVLATFVSAVFAEIKDPLNDVVKAGAKMLLELAAQSAKSIAQAKLGIDIDAIINENESKNSLTDAYRKDHSSIEQFKRKLSEFAQKQEKPLIFLIDELDRCRPNQAVEVLEVVKHFFDIPNAVFVFAINLEQIRKSIEHIYGGIDAAAYLRKFFDISYDLPELNTTEFITYCFEKNKNHNQTDEAKESVVSSINQDAISLGVKGRELERVVSYFMVLASYKAIQEHVSGFVDFVISVAFFKALDPNRLSLYARDIQSRSPSDGIHSQDSIVRKYLEKHFFYSEDPYSPQEIPMDKAEKILEVTEFLTIPDDL